MSLNGCDCTSNKVPVKTTTQQTAPAVPQQTQAPAPTSVFQDDATTSCGFGGSIFQNLLGGVFSIAANAAAVVAQNAPMICEMYMMDKFMNNNNCCHSNSCCAPARPPVVVRSYGVYPFARHFSRPMPCSFSWRPRSFTVSRPELYRPPGGGCFKPKPFGRNIC